MTVRNSNYFFVPSMVAFACLMASGISKADTPLSLVVSENLTYESNLLRNNDLKSRDVVSATGVQVGFNKAYGRQTYSAAGTVVATRYKNLKLYDNDGYNLALGFTTQIASNWYVSLDHNRVNQLQNFQDQGLNRYREPIKSQQTRAFAQYGLYGRWSLNGELNSSKVSYEVLSLNNRSADGAKVGVRYSPTDLLYFDVGLRQTDSHLPNYRVGLASADGERIKQQSLEFSTRWIVTGYSNFDGRVGWSRERYTMDEQRNFNGLTGYVSWNYTPAGKMAYSLALDRDTNNSGGSTTSSINLSQLTGTLGFNSQKRVSTGLSLRATYSATAKISLTASGSYRRIEEESRLRTEDLFGGSTLSSTGTKSAGSYRTFNIGANYQLFRSTRLGCSWEKYDRSASVFSREFSGDSVNCNAVFTMD